MANVNARNNVTKGVLFMLLTTLLASTAAAATKYIAEGATVEQIVFFQYLICLLLIIPLIRHPRQLRVDVGDRWAMFIRAMSGLVCFYSYFWAVRYIPLAEATLMRNSAPLFVPLFALWWLKAVISPFHIVSLVLGFIGVLIMLKPEAATSPGVGHLAALISALALAISIVSTRRLAHTSTTQTILFYYYLLSTIGMLPMAISNWQPIAPTAWPLIIYVGFAIHGALYLYTQALAYASAVVVAPIAYFSVVYAGLFDWLLWQQAPTWLAIAGMALVIGGGILTTVVSAKGEA